MVFRLTSSLALIFCVICVVKIFYKDREIKMICFHNYISDVEMLN